MPYFYEELALEIFSLRTGLELVRRKMKNHILNSIDPEGSMREDDFVKDIASLKRKPDAVVFLTSRQAKRIGLREEKTILFCEAEHSTPITAKALDEYSDLYDQSEDGYDFTIAVVVIERYGQYHFLDLGAIWQAFTSMAKKTSGQANQSFPDGKFGASQHRSFQPKTGSACG